MPSVPDFTVIIPARNEERYLPATLRALAQQSMRPAHVIVVDHLSTDRTAEVARAAGATVIRCEGRGVADARQMGLEAARSAWIATTDADCLPQRHWLARLNAATTGCVGLYGPMKFSGVRRIYADSSSMAYKLFLQACRMTGQPNLAGGNMAFSRSAALLVGGYPLVSAYEDVSFGHKLAEFGRVRYVSGALVLTSARRLKGGVIPFALRQAKNIIGQHANYFDEAEIEWGRQQDDYSVFGVPTDAEAVEENEK